MAEDLVVTRTLVVPAADLSERFSRSSGPGGQGVNTADSRVELSFDLARSRSMPERLRHQMLCRLRSRLTDGVLTVTASEHRAQLQNRAAARDRMARLLRAAAAAPPPVRRPTKPTGARRNAGSWPRSDEATPSRGAAEAGTERD